MDQDQRLLRQKPPLRIDTLLEGSSSDHHGSPSDLRDSPSDLHISSFADLEYPVVPGHEALDDALLNDPQLIRDELNAAMLAPGRGARPHSPAVSPLDRTDATYDIPMITLDTVDGAHVDQPGRASHDLDAFLNRLQWSGVLAPLAQPPASPLKFSEILTRLSDRVAGPHPPPTPLAERLPHALLWGDPDTSPEPELVGLSVRSHASTLLVLIPALPLLLRSESLTLPVLRHMALSPGPSLSLNQALYLGLDSLDTPADLALDVRLHPHDRKLLSVRLLPTLRLSSDLRNPFDTRPSHETRLSPLDPHLSHETRLALDSRLLPQWERFHLHGKSLRLFPACSRFRIACYKMVVHPKFNTLVLLFIVIQTALLAYRQWNPSARGGYVSLGYSNMDYVLIVINCLYTAEVAAKVVAFGLYDDSQMYASLGLPQPGLRAAATKGYFVRLYQEKVVLLFRDDVKVSDRVPQPRHKIDDLNLHRAFLRNAWHRLDAVLIGSFWISLLLSISHWDAENNFLLFRALSCVRILRLCNLTTGTSIILQAFESAMPQLVDVGIFMTCFWFIFAIIGVQSFKSSLLRHCEWTNPLDSSETYVNSDSFCGSWLGTDGVRHPYYYRDGLQAPYVKGFTCPKYSVCQSGENPNNGTYNFDNILQSMQMVFILMSVNTFSNTMYQLMDTDNIGASMFFIIGIFIMTVWLMNIFAAVIVWAFKLVQREASERRKENRTKRSILLDSILFSDDTHRKKVRDFIGSKPILKAYYRFEFIFIIVIVISIATQSLREADMTASRAHTLYHVEAAMTCILLLEIIIRFLLYYPAIKTFFISRKNCVDLGLAIITSIIILGPVKTRLGQAYYWLTFFQIARFYRVVLSFRITSQLWLKIITNIKPIFDLTLFFFLLLGLIGIIVARYFEGVVPEDEVDNIDWAMNTLPNTWMSLYVVASTENWSDVMFGLQEYSRGVFQRSLGAVVIIVWFVVSNSVIMNIFIAVIAKSLEVSEEGRKKHQLRQFIDDMTHRLQTVKSRPGWVHKMKSKLFKSREDKNIEKAVTNLLLSGSAVNEFLDSDVVKEQDELLEEEGNILTRSKNKLHRKVKAFFENPFHTKHAKNHDFENFEPAKFATRVITERRMLIQKQDEYLKMNPNYNTVLYMMKPNHKFRRFCQMIVPLSHGERVDGVEPKKTVSDIFLFVMFLSTIGIVATAAYLTPLYRREVTAAYGKWNWTFIIDTCFLAIFSTELSIKVVADGAFATPNAYARSPWNWLDFVALVSLWIDFVAYIRDDSNLSRIVRGIKALRALRILTISETAKNNFQFTMMSGFGKILSAAVISLTLLFPFSVWALNVFNGRLGYCLDGNLSYSECINEYYLEVYDWDVLSPTAYVNPPLHMDSFLSSFSAFYQIVSFEGWTDLLLNVMQSTGVGTPQEMFASPGNGLFIIFFNFISTVFILTLFVSVIIINYSKSTGRAYLTNLQIQWYHVRNFLLQVKPSKRCDITKMTRVQKFCYDMTVGKNKYWQTFLNVILLLHLLALFLEAFPTVVSDNVRYAFFVVVSICFAANSTMLLIAQGYKTFVSNKWNVMMLFIAYCALVLTVIGFEVSSASVFINFNKIFLVGLLVNLFPRSDRLSQLLKFGSASFPSLFALMFTWFVIFLAYAIAMNQVFGLTKIGPNTSNNINLRSVPKALILLFRCSFGEGWNYIMDDYTLEEPYCYVNSAGESDCGSLQYAYVLFMSWNLVSMYIMVNLFVSLIIDSFSYIAGGTEYAHLISRPEVRKFKMCWQKYDPRGTGYIPRDKLLRFLRDLRGTLSVRMPGDSIQELCLKWIVRNDPEDPYDITVDLDRINAYLETPSDKETQKTFEFFIEEALTSSELHEDPGILFSRIIVQIPLYTAFDPNQCLVLIDFLESRLLHRKIIKRLQEKRCYELVEGWACRWKYRRMRKDGLKQTIMERQTSVSGLDLD